MKTESDGPEKLLDAVSQRITAAFSVYADLTRLTVLEARLFASGSLFIVIISLIAALLCLVTWLLALGIIVLFLVESGVSMLIALSALLLLHLVVIVVLGFVIKNQLGNLRFSHVRDAFKREFDADAVEKPLPKPEST